jgi:hypothetical protein
MTAPVLLRASAGDCEDLAAYEAGWLQARGINARVYVRPAKSGVRGAYHAVVRIVEDGRTVTSDPAGRLGMRA